LVYIFVGLAGYGYRIFFLNYGTGKHLLVDNWNMKVEKFSNFIYSVTPIPGKKVFPNVRNV